MENISTLTYVLFAFATALTFFLLIKAMRFSKKGILVIIGWLVLQTGIALTGFYTNTKGLPPRFLLAVVPPLIMILLLFITRRGKIFSAVLDIRTLTLIHVVRVPVELCLYFLFLHKAVPELMTFSGRNFDILSGLTSPLIWYFGFIRKKLNKTVVLAWNFICLALLIHIVADAVLSAPFAFQQFAFDQPNIAVLYYPFVYLPCFIVPALLLAHVAVIKNLLSKAGSSSVKGKF